MKFVTECSTVQKTISIFGALITGALSSVYVRE